MRTVDEQLAHVVIVDTWPGIADIHLHVMGSRIGGSSSCSADKTGLKRLCGEVSIRVLRDIKEFEQGSMQGCQGGWCTAVSAGEFECDEGDSP